VENQPPPPFSFEMISCEDIPPYISCEEIYSGICAKMLDIMDFAYTPN